MNRKAKGDPGYPAKWCIHYCAPPMGIGNTAPHICEAGVNINEKFPYGTPFKERPCFLDDNGNSVPGGMTCEHLRRPTPDEIKAHEEWLTGRMDRMRVVMAGIHDWRKAHEGQSCREVVECPACKGRLHLSIAAYNGHVHGKCETEGCVSWME